MKHRGQTLPRPHVKRDRQPERLPRRQSFTPEPAYLSQSIEGPPELPPPPYLGPTETPSPTPIPEELPVPPVIPRENPKLGSTVWIQYPAGTPPVPAIVVGLGPAMHVSLQVFLREDKGTQYRPNLPPYSSHHPYGWYWPED